MWAMDEVKQVCICMFKVDTSPSQPPLRWLPRLYLMRQHPSIKHSESSMRVNSCIVCSHALNATPVYAI
jgi:hypothetical protein